MLQAAILRTIKQNHDQYDFRLEKRPVTMVRTPIRSFYGISHNPYYEIDMKYVQWVKKNRLKIQSVFLSRLTDYS